MLNRRPIIPLLAVFFLIGYLIYSLLSLGGTKPVVPASADFNPLPVIIIDPGHGGMDGGAVSRDGIVEKDINLAISLALRDMFVINGFEVVMTRDSDISIHDADVKGVKSQKTSDLRNRLKIVRSNPGAIFISIHQNKFGSAKSNGAQMFYGRLNPESEKLAEILQQRIASALQPENTRQIKRAGKDLYLMYNAECTSVLIECGFLSNYEESRRLVDPDYQTKLAFCTMISVFDFLGLDIPDGAAIQQVSELEL